MLNLRLMVSAIAASSLMVSLLFATEPSDIQSQSDQSGQAETTQSESTKIAVDGAAVSGMIATLDDSGKEYTPTTAEKDAQMISVDTRNFSHQGLKVEKAAKGEGEYVNLQGRFRSTMTAVLDENGKVKTQCDQGDHKQHQH